jgi:Fe2+ transport system protein B
MGGQNRIVVDYGDYEGLVLLGAFDTKSGVEINQTELQNLDGFEIVTTYKTWGEGYDLLKEEIPNNKEGYVIRFKNGFRMKIKGEEYLRLHKVMTEVSTKSVWEALSNGDNLENLLKDVPDEFYTKIKEYENKLISDFNKIKNEYTWYFFLIPKEDKKEFALIAKESKHPTILFNMLNGKDIDSVIWKIIQPKFKKL